MMRSVNLFAPDASRYRDLCASADQNGEAIEGYSIGFPAELMKPVESHEVLTALETFDGTGVLEAHEKLQGVAHELVSPIVLPSTEDAAFCKPFLKKSDLDPITLGELKPDCWHKGRALHGYLRAKAFKLMDMVVTVLEDDRGKVARLLIRNAASNDCYYPEGAEIVLHEPCLVSETFPRGVKGSSLWVTNPVTLEVIRYYPHVTMDVKDYETLKALGNDEFNAGNYRGAAELYGRCIQMAPADDVLLTQAYSNRAECYLMLGHYCEALHDCESALGLIPDHPKSLRRKRRALFGLRQFKGVEIQDGEYSDFIGPVEVQPDGGLVATSDLEMGDLLLVYNAVAIASGDELELKRRVIARCRACPRTLAQVYSLDHDGKDLGTDLYKPDWDMSAPLEAMELDVCRLEKIMTRHVEWYPRLGLWTLPSRLKQSCVSNVAVGFRGEVLFVRAARDIAAGTELVRPYGEVLRPRLMRGPLKGSDAECGCERCALEKRLEESNGGFISRQYQSLLQNILEWGVVDRLFGELAVLVEFQISVHVELNERERSWMRAAYAHCYSRLYRQPDEPVDDEEEDRDPLRYARELPPLEVFCEALHSTCPGFEDNLECMRLARDGPPTPAMLVVMKKEIKVRAWPVPDDEKKTPSDTGASTSCN